MKTAEAKIHLEVMCECPHCNKYVNLYSYLSGQVIDIFKYADNGWDIDVICSECRESFEIIIKN